MTWLIVYFVFHFSLIIAWIIIGNQFNKVEQKIVNLNKRLERLEQLNIRRGD